MMRTNIRSGSCVAVFLVALAMATSTSAAPSAGSVGPLTVTSVASSDFNGLVITFSVSGGAVGGCNSTGGYALRDSAIVNAGLAVLLSALAEGEQITIYVNGSCDSIGFPQVTSVSVS